MKIAKIKPGDLLYEPTLEGVNVHKVTANNYLPSLKLHLIRAKYAELATGSRERNSLFNHKSSRYCLFDKEEAVAQVKRIRLEHVKETECEMNEALEKYQRAVEIEKQEVKLTYF